MIGFMQGRLVPMVEGKIQAFPWEDWREEFPRAEAAGFGLMEWTLDQDRLYENPLMTQEGQAEIRVLCAKHGVSVGSLTGDCFMQAPFWKTNDPATRKALQNDLMAIVKACSAIGINLVVIPLVDGGRLENQAQEDLVVDYLTTQMPLCRELGVNIVFESDYEPARLAGFIDRLDAGTFGINYDTGNSTALGYDAAEEWQAYAPRILNVHIKDRALGGTTVPLGTGDADFDKAFGAMVSAGYDGHYILQTARADDGDDPGALTRNREFALGRMRSAGLDV